MPQLEPTGGDDLGAPDELIAFQDEGEEQDKGAGRGSAHGDLDELKSSLVSETENRGGPGPAVGPGPEGVTNPHSHPKILVPTCDTLCLPDVTPKMPKGTVVMSPASPP
ncbi:hypothetical protein DV515_00016898 [Chloebia gouldiae]|uniref:CTNNB1 binding N-teminal domain-containing protein n=1 Tax=Chloebia gouldiae TaxID=44316 RepID=A0A3L8RA03_CHLGU|nr:hypothetical protein DV515_00016899 [Chloebia gouldiae]RLV76515.1 hypothetical protein DV515_00016898 [Chloebia gouldiae]